MDIQNAKHTEDGNFIIATIDGSVMTVPVNGGNRFYTEIKRQETEEGLVVAEFVVSLEDRKKEALEGVKTEHAKQLNELTGNKTVEDRDTWKTQQEAANQFLIDGNEEDKEFLEGLLTDNEVAALTAANEPLAAYMANSIREKAKRTKKLIQMAGKMKRTAEEAINGATTLEVLEATIEALKAQEQATKEAFEASQQSQES